MNIWHITRYTLREALSKKVFISFFIISSLVLIGLLLFALLTDSPGISESINNSENKVPIEDIVMGLQLAFGLPIASLGLLLAIFACSGFISALFEKGNIDLFLSKPLERYELILGKYFGGLLMVFINMAYLIGGIWLIFSIKFGIWQAEYLLLIFAETLAFAVLNSLIILIAVLTKNSILAMMSAYSVILILSPILKNREVIFEMVNNKVVEVILNVFYYIIPPVDEIINKFFFHIYTGKGEAANETVYLAFVQIVFFITIAVFMFKKKDF